MNDHDDDEKLDEFVVENGGHKKKEHAVIVMEARKTARVAVYNDDDCKMCGS